MPLSKKKNNKITIPLLWNLITQYIIVMSFINKWYGYRTDYTILGNNM